MTRTEYLDTINGQLHERLKRTLKIVRLIVNQEPKGKNSSYEEKRTFRKEIKDQLRKLNRRPFRGDVILEIDYYTTKDNPPALQTLSKNYLDLLHKEMPHIDSLKGILYTDDGQLKILIANYHIDERASKNPCIEIKAYGLRYFLADLELAERIMTNKFSDSDYFSYSRFEEKLEEERYSNNKDYFEDLRELEEGKEGYDKLVGASYYPVQKNFILRQIQEQFLRQNHFDVSGLISIYSPCLDHNRKYSQEKEFQKIWGASRTLIFMSSSFLDFGNAPQEKGEKNIFKNKLQEKLKLFKEKYKLLFPLLQPISVIVTFVPPKEKVVDLDNLARYIVPFVNEIFEPPTLLWQTYDNLKLNDILKNEVEIIQKYPPNSIASYQLIHLPRQSDSADNGEIKFIITDGLYHRTNLWKIVDDTIYKWEDAF